MTELPPAPERRRDPHPGDNPVADWFFAILDGIADMVQAIIDRGRAGARDAYEEGWQRFDKKTRDRRK